MQNSSHSTLHPDRSRDALQKLREAAESDAASISPGVISTASGDVDFDVQRGKVAPAPGDPNDQFGAAPYSGQNSEHIGNGAGGPQ